jgi:betaine lipid synthase
MRVFKLSQADTVLTLTSGGCNTLNLLIHGAGHVRRPSWLRAGRPRPPAARSACEGSAAQAARPQPWAWRLTRPCPPIRPQVVSVDCNPAQSALLELKVVAAQQLDYEDYWQVFGEGGCCWAGWAPGPGRRAGPAAVALDAVRCPQPHARTP